jgi:hypothetical protein
LLVSLAAAEITAPITAAAPIIPAAAPGLKLLLFPPPGLAGGAAVPPDPAPGWVEEAPHHPMLAVGVRATRENNKTKVRVVFLGLFILGLRKPYKPITWEPKR